MNRIARRLKDFRLGNTHNQEGIAKVAGISQAAWSGWEKNPPAALQSLANLARHYGVSADYLLELTDNPVPHRAALDALLADLLGIANKLPNRRQRDLLLMARSYLGESQSKTHNADQLIGELIDLIEEYDGVVERDKLIDSIRNELGLRRGPALDGDDSH